MSQSGNCIVRVFWGPDHRDVSLPLAALEARSLRLAAGRLTLRTAGSVLDAGSPGANGIAEIFRRTPHRYLVVRRIKRARELLERTDMSVTAVCFEVGFESLGTFVARFRQIFGEPPGRYRQRFAHDGAPHLRAVPACLYRALAMRPPRTASVKDSNSEEADARARK